MPDLPPPSDVELTAWQALCEAATPGEWTQDPKTATITAPGGWALAHFFHGCADRPELRKQAMRDAAFIAAARTALPRLIAEIRQLREELADADSWPEVKARRAAVAAEREACAQVVEQYAEVHPARCVAGENCCREHLLIAAAIRARGQPPP